MNLASQPGSLVAYRLQLLHRRTFAYSHLCGKVDHTVNRAIPHDVLDVDVVADEHFAIIVYVDYAHKTVALLTEIIEERRVLTERIVGICRIVAWRFVIAEKYDNSVSYKFL